MNETKYVLVRGNPFDGMTLTGPFDTHEAAVEYADEFAEDKDWWVIGMQEPA